MFLDRILSVLRDNLDIKSGSNINIYIIYLEIYEFYENYISLILFQFILQNSLKYIFSVFHQIYCILSHTN